MSKLLKDFHSNLKNLSLVNLEKPTSNNKLNMHGANVKLVPRNNTQRTTVNSKNDDKGSIKSNNSKKR